MNKKTGFLFSAIAILLLMSLAIGSRFWLVDWPNFKPVFAIAVFLGFYCRNLWAAFIATMGIMLISDAMIGFYAFELMAVVYLAMLPAIAIGYLLANVLNQQLSPWMQALTIGGAFLSGSITFFLTTNSAVCFLTDWYPNSVSGWIAALAAGLPFFKYTLAGDMVFGTFIFSSYFMVQTLHAKVGRLRSSARLLFRNSTLDLAVVSQAERYDKKNR